MVIEVQSEPTTGVPAFPGKVVVLGADPYQPGAVLTGCVFETLAGRTYIVGRDQHSATTRGLPGGVLRYVAWDGTYARDIVVFDRIADYLAWKDQPLPQDDIPF